MTKRDATPNVELRTSFQFGVAAVIWEPSEDMRVRRIMPMTNALLRRVQLGDAWDERSERPEMAYGVDFDPPIECVPGAPLVLAVEAMTPTPSDTVRFWLWTQR